MGETIPSQPIPKKMVSRNVAVTLGIICILLIVGLGVAMAYLYDLNNTLNLGKSTVWVNDETVTQAPGTYTTWTFSASYAGYVSIFVRDSGLGVACKVEAFYSTVVNGELVSYSHEDIVYQGSSAAFAVVPSPSITVGVGNGLFFNNNTETVTITYYY
jgi:hypothetical protein